MKVVKFIEDNSMYCEVPYGGGGKEATFCANGNIKIIIHTADKLKYSAEGIISEADLELLYVRKNYIYTPLFFNGRLL